MSPQSESDAVDSWRQQVAGAQAILEQANEASGGRWRLESRFADGLLEGAWRVRDGSAVAVLKWHDATAAAFGRGESFATHGPYNPDAVAIVEYLRAEGYPTPAWYGAGATATGAVWSLQEFVDAEAIGPIEPATAELFIELIERQRTIRLPTSVNWNPYIRSHVFGEHATHRRLTSAGEGAIRVLDSALSLAAPYESTSLVDDEMVHCDLSISNVLVRGGRVVAVIDTAGAARGCAAYDALSPVVNGVWWNSDSVAVERLVGYTLTTYGPATVAVVAACLAIETADWYFTHGREHAERPASRLYAWVEDLRHRLARR